ncbi:MAG: hypothetical protein ABJ092_10925 [Gillisia sp.]
MKTKKITGSILLFLMSFMGLLAQEEQDMQMFLVHEDRTKPAMAKKHETIDKELIGAMRQNEINDFSWITLVTEDFRYIYISPLDKMADLDKDPFASLSEKIGQRETKKIFDKFNDTYEEHGDYILILDKKLSYQPGGINTTPVGKNYRHITMYHYTPANAEKAEDLAERFLDLYTKKNSQMDYRLYRSGFGIMGSFFWVVTAAESPEDFERMREDNRQLFGQEGESLVDKLLQTVSRIEVIRGYIRPDLGYQPRN